MWAHKPAVLLESYLQCFCKATCSAESGMHLFTEQLICPHPMPSGLAPESVWFHPEADMQVSAGTDAHPTGT